MMKTIIPTTTPSDDEDSEGDADSDTADTDSRYSSEDVSYSTDSLDSLLYLNELLDLAEYALAEYALGQKTSVHPQH